MSPHYLFIYCDSKATRRSSFFVLFCFDFGSSGDVVVDVEVFKVGMLEWLQG